MLSKFVLAATVVLGSMVAMVPEEADARGRRCGRGYYRAPARVSYGYAPRYYAAPRAAYYGGPRYYGGPGYWGPRNNVGVTFGHGGGFYYGW